MLTLKVCWSIIAFIWGSLNLWAGTTIAGAKILDSESQQWSFGQVIAIVLLIVPLIGLIEGYFRRKSSSHRTTFIFPTSF
jgi:hypothetical protein